MTPINERLAGLRKVSHFPSTHPPTLATTMMMLMMMMIAGDGWRFWLDRFECACAWLRRETSG